MWVAYDARRRLACRRLLRATNLSCRHQPGTEQSYGSEEQLDHRQLACRMTGCLVDGLPQAVPRSGMGALIAAQGGQGFGGGPKPGLCRTRCSRPTLTKHAGSASRFRYCRIR